MEENPLNSNFDEYEVVLMEWTRSKKTLLWPWIKEAHRESNDFDVNKVHI
jgi:hypothetical protein